MNRDKMGITAFLLTFVIAVCAVFMPVKVEAASKAHMKKVNVKWDLKKNKSLTYKTKYAGLGMMDGKVKITKFKIKNSKKKGYKELTFTVTFTLPGNISKEQVHKCANSKEATQYQTAGAYYFLTVVDYDTGKTLEVKNNKGVTVEGAGSFTYPEGRKYYRDDDGCYVALPKKIVAKNVKVTYPKGYKGLCIGVGGSTAVKEMAKDTKFWNGKAPFGKTNLYSKKDKSVAHFMRVTK